VIPVMPCHSEMLSHSETDFVTYCWKIKAMVVKFHGE
jgi:hypothetical protein